MLKNIPVGDTERPVPPWALRLAKALPLVLLPHCLWRLPFAVDFRMGLLDPDAPGLTWWAPLYVTGLSVVTEALALLTLGLVSGWGEVFPSWVPVLRGRRVPPLAAVIPATLGGLTLVALFDPMPLAWFDLLGFAEAPYANGWWQALARVCTSTAMLWGPITLALTYSYYRRRRRTAGAVPPPRNSRHGQNM
ncbi:hypothetical protein BX285_3077 [Streptomyces sp. 1114.5]|uniref:hypothetical protein n=1 Tax=unclassified Streptomyces TaxID=2593676 RepID=UPI000BC9B33D|nr:MULTISPECIES: hypothetical protein [unclassified Streptomyces]RKT18647.1 hypothetical protein BX285_3077 [Streptomyces sp. 1114.5]SOB84849.1 hypothetical protein SAMN06272789_5111 [Streptomyces sp. 1331.2]